MIAGLAWVAVVLVVIALGATFGGGDRPWRP